ncbi:MAG TPA: LLM class flavin-dependent oxidoreductase [Actinomycetota bacterium]|nr:LLM class flavin-dependent oxidoreductase [Actinomycetota bacterium]
MTEVGIGLPSQLPGVTGPLLAGWARRAEERGFASLATIDRVVYSNLEPMAALAAAAVVTERITLFTNILLAPVRLPVMLAKQAASVDLLSGGRLRLGLAPGGREDDYTATGMRFANRGRRFDAQLALMQGMWKGIPVPGTTRPVGPVPARGGIPVLIGGTSDRAIARVVAVGDGWTAGSGAGDAAGTLAERVRRAWADAGRAGEPYLTTLAYFYLGSDLNGALDNLTDYYGPERGPMVAARTGRTPEGLRAMRARAEESGFDELVLYPAVADPAEVDRLADAVL